MKKLLVIALILSGCTKGEVLMELAGSFAALSSEGPGPFTPAQEDAHHAVFQGTCIDLVIGFQIQVNDSPWFNIPMTAGAPGAGETAPGGYTYDLDCSDKYFTFWIYHSQIEAWAAAESYTLGEVRRIAIRGVTNLSYTEPTVYEKYVPVPNELRVSNYSTKVGVGQNQCFDINLSLHDNQGGLVSYSAPISFALSLQVNSGAITSSYNLYQSYDDCSGGTSNKYNPSSITIPAGTSEIRAFYKVTESINDQLNFVIDYSGSPVTLFVSAPITRYVRDGSARYLQMEVPHRIVDETCYPLIVRQRYYNGSMASGSISISLTKPSELKVYNEGSCTNEISSLFLSSSEGTYYFKATGIPAGVSYGNLSIGSGEADGDSSMIWYDKTGSSNVTQFEIHTSSQLVVGWSNWISIDVYNENGTPVPLTTAMDLNLSATGAGAWYCPTIYASCSGDNDVTTVTLPAGSYRQNLIVNPQGTGSVTLSVDATNAPYTELQNILIIPAVSAP